MKIEKLPCVLPGVFSSRMQTKQSDCINRVFRIVRLQATTFQGHATLARKIKNMSLENISVGLAIVAVVITLCPNPYFGVPLQHPEDDDCTGFENCYFTALDKYDRDKEAS